ncbi:MAG: hypothetical protein VCB99_01970 [Myxococcota bacterium]
MSTILDALRRVERERRPPANARSLREAVASGHEVEDAASSRAWRVPLISLLLGLGLGAGVLLLWGGGPERGTATDTLSGESSVVASAAPAERMAESTAQAVAATAPAAVPAKPPAPVKRKPSTKKPDRRLFDRLRADSFRPGHATMLAAQAPRSRMRGVAPGGTAVPYPFDARPPRAAPERRVTAEPQVAVVPIAPSPPSPAPEVAKGSPLAVQVERTFWHPRAERREAILRMPDQEELVRVREGEALGRFTVMLIEPSRVVFEKDGVEIVGRLRAK